MTSTKSLFEGFEDLISQRVGATFRARRLIRSGTPFIVTGLPGVGKTQFVKTVAYYPSKTPNTIEWVNLPSNADPLTNINLSLMLIEQNRSTQEMIVVLDGADLLTDAQVRQTIRRYKAFKVVRTVIATSRRKFDFRDIEEIALTDVPEKVYDLTEQVTVQPSIVAPNQRQIIKAVAPIIVTANDVLIEKLKRQPSDLFKITSRQFEEVIADLLSDMGIEVELTPQTRDGGKDILAYMDTPIGKVLCLVEAKQHKETRPVGVNLVRSLYGTVVDQDASKGMLVTTSRFTKDAAAFQQKYEYILSLKDYSDVLSWILKYKQQ